MTRRSDPKTLGEASQVLGLSIPATARLIGISETAAYECFNRGELPGRRIAGRCIVSAPELLAMFGIDSDVGNAVAEAGSSLGSEGAHDCTGEAHRLAEARETHAGRWRCLLARATK
jgi:hypothetical protein